MDEQTNNTTPNDKRASEPMKMPQTAGGKSIEGTSYSVINGQILIVLALLLVIILGGMYYWFVEINSVKAPIELPPIERPTTEENNEPESTTAEAQTDALRIVSSSDEIEAIEADIEATDLDALDAELEAIEAELEAALQ